MSGTTRTIKARINSDKGKTAGATRLILLTRLDKSKVLVNIDTVKFIESTPDTLISFVNGDSVMVRESLEEIDRAVLQYKVTILKLSQETEASGA